MTDSELMELARKASLQAYAPYSGFSVGAALLCSDGRVFSGCNVENASYGAAICAERTAFCKAVSEGARDFIAIAVYGGERLCPPCGICRQFMSELVGADFRIILSDGGNTVCYRMPDMLPHSFSAENL